MFRHLIKPIKHKEKMERINNELNEKCNNIKNKLEQKQNMADEIMKNKYNNKKINKHKIIRLNQIENVD
jgi:hypothetical protein